MIDVGAIDPGSEHIAGIGRVRSFADVPRYAHAGRGLLVEDAGEHAFEIRIRPAAR